MTSGKTEMTKSTSAAVESRPREKRTSELADAFLPIAKITWLGSNEPAEHAEPLEAQIPSMSKPAINAMPSEPRTTNENVLTKQFSRGLTISQPFIFSTAAANFNKYSFKLDLEKTGGFTNLSSAATRPMMAGRFSVPARRSFSCRRQKNRIGMQRRFDVKQTRAFRPVKFVRANRN